MAFTNGHYSNHHGGPSVVQNLAKTKRVQVGSDIPKKICDFVFRRNVDNQVYRSESFRFIQKTDTFLTPEAANSRRGNKVPVNENYIDPVDYQTTGKEEPAYNEIVEPYRAPYYYSDTIKDPTYYSPCPVRKNSNHYNSRRSKSRGQFSRQSLSLAKSDAPADGQDLPSQLCNSNGLDKLLVSIKLESLDDDNLSISPKHNQYISICHIRTSPHSTLTNSSSSAESSSHSESTDNSNDSQLRSSHHRYLKASAVGPKSSQNGRQRLPNQNQNQTPLHRYTESVSFYRKDDGCFESSGDSFKKAEFSPSTNVPQLNGDTNLRLDGASSETFKNNDYDNSEINKDRVHQGKDLTFGANIVKATTSSASEDTANDSFARCAEMTNGTGVLSKCVKKSCKEYNSSAFCDNALMGSDHFYSSVGRNLSSLRVGDTNQMTLTGVTLDSITDDQRRDQNSKCELNPNEEQQSHLVPYSAQIIVDADLNSAQIDCDYVKSPHLGGWGAVDFKYTINSYHLELDPSMSLESQDWFHGAITRLESEQILKATKMGSFLVRNCENSSRNHFSLSIKCSRGFIHIRIEPNSRGTYTLGDKDFPSVPYLIHHFMLHRLPIKGAEHFKLMYPVITQLL